MVVDFLYMTPLVKLVQIQIVVFTHTKQEFVIGIIIIIIIKLHNSNKLIAKQQVDKDLKIPILLEILLVNNCLDNSHIIINIIKQVIRVILPSILVKVKYIRTF